MLPPNPSNLEDLDLAQSPHLDTDALPPPSTIGVPVTLLHTLQLPLVPDMPNPVRTCLWDPLKTQKLTERGQIFEAEIEAKKLHLARVQEVAAHRGGVRGRSTVDEEGAKRDDSGGDDNPFAALCSSGMLEEYISESQVDSVTMAASLDTDKYLRRDVDNLCEATLLSIRSDMQRNPLAEGYDMKIPPASHWEAERRTDAEEWRKVTEKELGDLKRMGVYEDAEELPEGKKAIGCHWVYEFKVNESGGPPTYKACLVAQGFSQVPFMDYGATFAPVTKSVTVQFVAVYSALHGWHLQCFDAARAFLHGGLTGRELFMRCPPPLPPGLWRLLKSIYGLKQASRIWYRLLRKVLETLGFTRSEFDHALFIFNRTWGSALVHCLLAMHVDDGLAGCNSEEFLAFIKMEIRKRFGIKDLGPLKTFVGIQFKRDYLTREIWIHQEMYINLLLAEHNMG